MTKKIFTLLLTLALLLALAACGTTSESEAESETKSQAESSEPEKELIPKERLAMTGEAIVEFYCGPNGFYTDNTSNILKSFIEGLKASASDDDEEKLAGIKLGMLTDVFGSTLNIEFDGQADLLKSIFDGNLNITIDGISSEAGIFMSDELLLASFGDLTEGHVDASQIMEYLMLVILYGDDAFYMMDLDLYDDPDDYNEYSYEVDIEYTESNFTLIESIDQLINIITGMDRELLNEITNGIINILVENLDDDDISYKKSDIESNGQVYKEADIINIETTIEKNESISEKIIEFIKNNESFKNYLMTALNNDAYEYDSFMETLTEMFENSYDTDAIVKSEFVMSNGILVSANDTVVSGDEEIYSLTIDFKTESNAKTMDFTYVADETTTAFSITSGSDDNSMYINIDANDSFNIRLAFDEDSMTAELIYDDELSVKMTAKIEFEGDTIKIAAELTIDNEESPVSIKLSLEIEPLEYSELAAPEYSTLDDEATLDLIEAIITEYELIFNAFILFSSFTGL